MNWTKEDVEYKLAHIGSVDVFIQNGGVLKLKVCGTHLLFIANIDNTVSAYYEYLPSSMEVARCVYDFLLYAIPYLTRCLSERSKNTLLSPYCIEPICID